MAWAPDYTTLARLKAFLRITDTVDDVELAVAITSASRAIDRHTNRQFGVVAAAEERFYTAFWDRRRRRWVVPVDDFQTVTNLVVKVDGVAETAFTKEPRNAAAKGRPWELIVFDPEAAVKPTGAEYEIGATAIWGWTTVPVPVEEGAFLQSSRFKARRDSPFGIAGSPDMGSELRLLAKLDPDVAVSLGSYIRWWAGA